MIKIKRSLILLIVFVSAFGLEMTTYVLDALNIWTNYVWIFAVFVVLSIAIIWLKQYAIEKGEKEASEIFEERVKE